MELGSTECESQTWRSPVPMGTVTELLESTELSNHQGPKRALSRASRPSGKWTIQMEYLRYQETERQSLCSGEDGTVLGGRWGGTGPLWERWGGPCCVPKLPVKRLSLFSRQFSCEIQGSHFKLMRGSLLAIFGVHVCSYKNNILIVIYVLCW